MVCEWGMSDLGPLAFRKPGNAFEGDKQHVLSEATARRVDDEIRKVIMSGYDRARQIIDRNSEAVRMLADELLQQESLEADEIKDILERAGARI
jgi:cell division protease FtsH